MKSQALKAVRMILSVLSFLTVLIGLGICFLPYGFLKTVSDQLSPDGNYQSFTPAFRAALRLPAVGVGLFFLLIGLGLLVFPAAAERSLRYVKRIFDIWVSDGRQFFRDLRGLCLSWKENTLLAAVFLLGLLPRLLLLNRSIEYDEAYTFTQFARYPFRVIISDYSAPNNHVFHTILMRIAYLLLGDQAWQIRLPAFLAGLLILLCAYWLGRMLYNKTVGYLAAGILASLPDFILRSVSARGYTIVVLMTLLGFCLGGYVLRKKNLFGWCLLILFCAIGFYSVPIMLYPFCVLFLWLLLSVIDLGNRQYTWKSWTAYLFVAAVLTIGMTVLLYSPILLSPNIKYFYASNNILHPASLGGFIQVFPSRLQSVVNEWQRYLPPAWSVVIALGLFLSFVWIWRNKKFKVPTQLAFLLGLVIVLLIQRPDSVTRIWLWIVPLLAIWSAAGIVVSLQSLPIGKLRNILIHAIPVIIVAGMAVNAIEFSYTSKINQWGEDPVVEQVTVAILPHLTPDSYVVVNGCFDARYWFYFFNHGVPLSLFYGPKTERAFDKVIAIVYTADKAGCGTEPVTETLRLYGPDASLLDMSTLKPIETIYYVTAYEVLSHH
jgi:hypothetical protein